MLHIILGILKVIGILLLAVIGLVLLMVLSLLFVPVQYRFSGKKLEKVLEGQAAVSWLFGMIGLSAEYRGKKLVIHLKLFGFIVKSFGEVEETKKKTKQSGGKRIKKRKKQKTSLSNKEKEVTETVSKEPSAEVSEEVLEETDSEVPELFLDEEEMNELFPDIVESQEKDVLEEQERKDQELPKQRTKEPQNTFFEKIGSLLKRIFSLAGKIISFIFSIPERILDLWGKLWEIADAGESAIDKLVKKKDEIYKMAKPFLTDNSKALYKRILGHLLYLWKHYKPRKIQGWMRYGTGAPDVTGQLTGILYMILPVSADKFELLPEFTEKIFETDVMIKGHIRACHLVRVAFLLWRDKQLMGLIRRVRAKGGK